MVKFNPGLSANQPLNNWAQVLKASRKFSRIDMMKACTNDLTF